MNIKNKITAAEAKSLAEYNKVKEKFLKAVYERIREEAIKEKTECKYRIYDQSIGDVNALYSRETDLKKILTPVGLDCVNSLVADGYKVVVSLYYEERQFVDMRLQFNISWA